VEFPNKVLFEDNQSTIRPNMKGLFDRAMEVVRENSDKPLLIEMYATSVQNPLADERRKAVVALISEATHLPAMDVHHKIDKITGRGDVIRFVLNAK
jgi:hypothetical protein